MLKEEKYIEVSEREPRLNNYYEKLENGFYKVSVKDYEKDVLKNIFRKLGFTALNFTDSRRKYQLYYLGNLWNDINKALNAEVRMWHPATEPVSAGELYKYLTGEEFVNELAGIPADYDYRTIHDGLFGGDNGYIIGKQEVLRQIESFIRDY